MKIASYNIQEGGESRLEEIVTAIRQIQPDAVALLEAMDLAALDMLAQELAMQPVLGEASNGVHLAWLSRLPVHCSQNHRSDALAKTLLEIEIEWEGVPLRLFATHLASRHDRQVPEDEVKAILEVLSLSHEYPHLLVGDFNALRPGDPTGAPPQGVKKRGDAVPGALRNAIRQILDAGYTDCYRSLHPSPPGYTYPSNHPWLRLDYIFASPQMAARLVECNIVKTTTTLRASDHLPIWAHFQ